MCCWYCSVQYVGAYCNHRVKCIVKLFLSKREAYPTGGIIWIKSAQLCCFDCMAHTSVVHSFIHSIGMCRMRRFLAVLRSFFHSSLLYIFCCHPSPPTILPSSLTLSCHLFLGLLLNLVVPKFMYNAFSGILFSSILCTCPNQYNLFNLIVFTLQLSNFIIVSTPHWLCDNSFGVGCHY